MWSLVVFLREYFSTEYLLYRRVCSWLVLLTLILQWSWDSEGLYSFLSWKICASWTVGCGHLSIIKQAQHKWDCVLLYSTPLFPYWRKESFILVLATVPFLWAGGAARLMCLLMFSLCFQSFFFFSFLHFKSSVPGAVLSFFFFFFQKFVIYNWDILALRCINDK